MLWMRQIDYSPLFRVPGDPYNSFAHPGYLLSKRYDEYQECTVSRRIAQLESDAICSAGAWPTPFGSHPADASLWRMGEATGKRCRFEGEKQRGEKQQYTKAFFSHIEQC
jgi:hypothetical protein